MNWAVAPSHLAQKINMISYWEREALLQYDHLIIGSGIVGLSTAISLQEKYPKQRIAVLERGVLPTGASTKNAGFACIGSLTEILDDLTHLSEKEVVDLVERRRNGLATLRQRLGDEAIEYLECGSYEIIGERELPALEELERINTLLKPMLGQQAFSLCSEKRSDFGFASSFAKAMILNHCEGQIHTGKMMRALLDKARTVGVQVLTGVTVSRIEETEKQVNLVAYPSGKPTHQYQFVAPQVYICTNAFSKQFLPNLDLQPGRGQVLVTHPIPNLPFEGIFHFDEGYFYFRNHGKRVIFGGGRNLDFEGEQSTQLETTPLIMNALETHLRENILPNTPFEIDMRWAGVMGFGKTKVPIVKRHSERIAIGIRMGGMGVAIGSLIGAELASLG